MYVSIRETQENLWWIWQKEKNLNDDNRVQEIERAKEDLMRERKKIQTANLEYHANMRNEARGEMFNEFILEAIDRLEPLKKPDVVLPVSKKDRSVGAVKKMNWT